MYALITIFISAWLVDLVLAGISYTKAFLVISEQVTEIARAVLHELDRGATILKGQGMYTGLDRDILLVIVNRNQVIQLKELIYQKDPRAFVVLADVHEVLGEGFKQYYLER
jgi:uncharacterized membrane-anchored protein YitT (DUF2179 family)